MGLFEDIGNAIGGAVSDISREISRATDNIRREFERGDVGAFTGKMAGTVWRGMKAPLEIAYDVSRGDIQHAKGVAGSAIGAGINQNQNLYGYLAQTSKGQEFLSDKNVDRYSLGFSGDYAGTMRGANELQYTGDISQENLDDTFRFTGKVAGVGAATTAYNAYQSASAVGGSAIPGYTAAATTGAGYAKDASLVYGAGKALSRGDVAGAVNTINQVEGDYGLPQLPTAPDWVPDLGAIIDGLTGGSSAPVVSNPWAYAGQVDSGSGPSMPQAAGASILMVAAVAGAIYMAKKGKI